jgi:hypothetical protein
MTYDHVYLGDVRVSYTAELEGGGHQFGQAYVPFVRRNVGFSLLAAGLCDFLDLADVNERAAPVVADTVRANGLGGQESHRFSAPEDFRGLIEDSGLEVAGVFDCGPGYEDYYFLCSRPPAAGTAS